ncbi:MAG: TIGR03089 family protein [Actinomycetota bacterium]
MAKEDTPTALLESALRTGASRPLLTYYDGPTGARVELSVATFATWVAKTAGLLTEGLGVGPGGRATLLLPLHWLTPVWYAACWAAGVLAGPVAPPAGPGVDVAVCGPDRVDQARARGAAEVVVVSLAPLGAPTGSAPPPGVLDYAAEVPAYPDQFLALGPPDPAAPALQVPDRATPYPAGELVALARSAALAPGERLLVTAEPATLADVLALTVAPWAVGGSVVLARNLDPASLVPMVTRERVTAVVGPAPALPGTRAVRVP